VSCLPSTRCWPSSSCSDVALRVVRRGLAIASAGLATLAFAPAANAASAGSLDSSFASGGVFTGSQTSTREGADAVAVQDDGKVVYGGITSVAGQQQAMVGRLTSSGTPDPGFSDDGFLAFGAGRTAAINSVQIADDGKILVGGVSANGGVMSFLLARLTPDGALDSSFGNGGIVTTLIGSAAMGMSIAIQPDGQIVEAGSATVAGQLEFAAARYSETGALDSSFGSDGTLAVAIGSRAGANGVAIQSDGGIDLGGEATVAGLRQFAAVQLTADGQPDSRFGKAGVVVVPDGLAAVGDAIVVQPDGGIVLAGGGFPGYPSYAAVRLTQTGALDDRFGKRGVVNVLVPGGGIANGMALQGNGQIVLAGVANVAGNPFGVVRLNPDGSRDMPFGVLGIVTNLLNVPAAPNGVAIEPDGNIVVAGGRRNANGNINTVVAQLLG
jgi:uncharacterized delta-60 repeat protein